MDIAASSLPRSRAPGRPREFDLDEALDGAVRVFRERGFHATSVGDLCSAMNLTTGSIYKAFGDKRAVFLAAFDRYTQQRNDQLDTRLTTEQTGLAQVGTVLHCYAEVSSGIEGRRGCLVAASALALATFDDEIAERVEQALRRLERRIGRCVVAGQADGSISPQIDAAAAARSLLCLLQGFRVLGKLGRSRSEMAAAADIALLALV